VEEKRMPKRMRETALRSSRASGTSTLAPVPIENSPTNGHDGGEKPTWSLKDAPPSERPRERLVEHGPEVLRTAELLAIILSTGTAGETVTELSDRLLTEFGGLTGLSRVSVSELLRRRGLGPAKATQLKAALELARRLRDADPEQRPQVRSPKDVADLLQFEMSQLDQEQLRVLLLDTKNRVISKHTIYVGTANLTHVRVGEIFKAAVRENAVSIVVVHNHPSGDPTPSADDVRLTETLVDSGKLLDIEILDHIVLARHGHVSLKERRLGFR
jgi:DNA repair protein RadC